MADLAVCVLCATLRLAMFYHQEHDELDYETTVVNITTSETTNIKQTDVEYISFNPNASNTWDKKPDGTPLTSSWNAIISTPSPDYNVTTSTLETPNEKNSTKHVHPKLKDLVSSDPILAVVMILMVVGFFIYVLYILLEIWMCRTLLGASSKRDSSECKKWFWIRLSITVLSFMMSLAGIAIFRNDWMDCVLDTVIIYRVYELFVVNEFRKEILATGGVVRFGVQNI